MAIVVEAIATLSLKLASEKAVPWMIVAYLCYGGAFALFPMVLKNINVGTAYAVWSGMGCVLALIGGVILFDEKVDARQLLCVLLILAGVCGVVL